MLFMTFVPLQYAAAVFIIVVLEIIAGIVAFVFRDDLVSDTSYNIPLYSSPPSLPPFLPPSLLPSLQINEINANSLDALSRYRVPAPDDPSVIVEQDVNDFVAFVQTAVCSYPALFSCSLKSSLLASLLWCQ